MTERPLTWPGGRIRYDRNGRPMYVIRRQWRGKRYTASTGRTTLAAAMAELARWERDPERYDPRGESAQAVTLTGRRVVGYLNWCRDTGRAGDRWLRQARGYLKWWAHELVGVDLRTITPARVEESLARGRGARQHRIATLRAIVTWLVRQGEIDRDPLRDRLPVPPSRPAQWKRSRTVTREEWATVTHSLPQPWQDAMVVLGATGWHLTELEGFARAGVVEGDVLHVPRAKSGAPHRTRVPPEVVEAAARLRARGGLSSTSLTHAVRKVADKAGIPVRPGSARHCVSTWAMNAGATSQEVADYLGHRSSRTTRRHYATHAIPARPRGLE